MAVVELEFESLDFRHQSQVFKNRDSSFQNSFKRMLTYYIYSLYWAKMAKYNHFQKFLVKKHCFGII